MSSPFAAAGKGDLEQVDAGSASIAATAYTWVDPAAIPPRQRLYGRHLIRKFYSITVAPGGDG